MSMEESLGRPRTALTEQSRTHERAKSGIMSAREERNLTNLHKDIEKNMAVITLVQGALADGTPHYAYALIPKAKYKPFKLAEMTGSYNLADYGTIVAHGEGLFPPADVQETMRETYGADPAYGEHVINTLTHCAEMLSPNAV